MFLNREKIAAGLSLVILILGIYSMASSRVSSSHREISKEIPSMPLDVARLSPRLYVEDRGAERNPFQLASDWTTASAEPLEPPETEPALWISLPLGRGPDPAIAGFGYLKQRPVEKKDDEQEETPAGEPQDGAKPEAAPGTPPPESSAGAAGPAAPAGATPPNAQPGSGIRAARGDRK